MNTCVVKTIGRLGAVASFSICLLAGLWILSATGLDHAKENVMVVGLGLYFVGKAFFVGPMLWVASEQLGREKPAA